MQCVGLRKRSLEPEVEPWRSKRACLEAGLESDCPMETSPSLNWTCQREQNEQKVQVRLRPQLHCPRCLSGEPGHINHILGL